MPEIANDIAAQDLILGASREGLASWSSSRFESTLESHVDAISDIRETLKRSYTAGEGKSANPEDALVVWLELLNERIGGESLLAVADKHDATPSAPRGLKK
jgi:hypothetical protein